MIDDLGCLGYWGACRYRDNTWTDYAVFDVEVNIS
jgi:hypothetical protein